MADSFGMHLMNSVLPAGVTPFNDQITKKEFNKKLVEVGRKAPRQYGRVVQELKGVGDTAATFEGISVGLDDIEPDYERRDAILKDALSKVQKLSTTKEKDIEKRQQIILDTQDKLLKTLDSHHSDMALMARSGGRGSTNQLAKTVVSPLAITEKDGSINPWLIGRGYAEGLRPDEAWVANAEARRGAIATKQSVSDPGAFGKIMTSNMSGQVVVKEDCGTNNGNSADLEDPYVVDRCLSKAVNGFAKDTVITPETVSILKKKKIERVTVRSPLTCEVGEGLCQRCYGLDEKGQFPRIGTNLGVRSAQALSEPLTQFALNAKHGVRIAQRKGNVSLKGLKGIQHFLEFPKSFNRKAIVSPITGKVQNVTPAPQGGSNITLVSPKNKEYKLYAPPALEIKVQSGQQIHAGDSLTTGIALPDDVVPYKGIGAGRDHIAKTVHEIYRVTGSDLDKRHAELLAKSHLNYARVADDPDGIHLPGEIVPVGSVHSRFTDTAQQKKAKLTAQLRGSVLGENVLQYNAGTKLTTPIIDALRQQGIQEVSVYTGGLRIKPIVKPLTRNPLLSPKWMTKMQHRYLKKTLQEAAATGAVDTIHGTEPIPAYVFGAEFGLGTGGKY